MLNICGKILAFVCVCLVAMPVQAKDAFVVNIPDANTIQVASHPKATAPEKTVQLYGVLAPSLQQPFGREAVAELRKLMPNGTRVEIEAVGNDNGAVETGLVQVNGRSVNYLLVSKGLAWVNRTRCTTLYCRRWLIEEHRAVKAKLGVWSVDEAYRPWQWSHGQQ